MLEAVYLFNKLLIIVLLYARLRDTEVNRSYRTCPWSSHDPGGEQDRQVRRPRHLSELWHWGRGAGGGSWGVQDRASCLPTSGVTPHGSQTTVPRGKTETVEAIMVRDTGPAGNVT